MARSIAELLQDARQAHGQGRLAEAERLYRAVLADQPDSFDGLFLFALLLMQQGRTDEAAPVISTAVKRRPNSIEALSLLASILATLDRVEEALGYFDRVLALQPGNVDARYNRAVAQGGLGRLAEALADYDHVLAAMPDHVPAYFNRGNVLGQLGRYEDALASYDRAIALAPKSADLLTNRGNALAELRRHDEALTDFQRAIALRPDHLEALNNRAVSLNELGRRQEALASSEQALALQPDYVNALVTRGNILRAMQRDEDALASYEKALVLAPLDVEIINNRGISLLDLGRAQEALSSADRALALAPNHAALHFLRGSALQALNRHEDAIDEYERASAIRPDYPDAAVNRSLSHLHLGQFAEGWKLYEQRWAPGISTSSFRQYPKPLWSGKRVPGALLVWGEQGLGDVILYAGMLPELERHAGSTVVEVEPRLTRLFARSFPTMQVIAMQPELYAGSIDAHVPLGSLGSHFRSSWDAFPKPGPGYLVADDRSTTVLRRRLAGEGKLVVGLSWISTNRKVGKFKSARLSDFEGLLRLPGCRFVDLQYGDTAVERRRVQEDWGIRVERLEDIDNQNDIDALSALITACDVVVTVSNTTAHLAGALGTPTWVMVPFGSARLWYWFKNRGDSPWYPRVQVRFQAMGQAWKELVSSVALEVQASVTPHR